MHCWSSAWVGQMVVKGRGVISEETLAMICARLAACHLIFSSSPREGCVQLHQLNVPSDDVDFATRNDPICSKALDLLRGCG